MEFPIPFYMYFPKYMCVTCEIIGSMWYTTPQQYPFWWCQLRDREDYASNYPRDYC